MLTTGSSITRLLTTLLTALLFVLGATLLAGCGNGGPGAQTNGGTGSKTGADGGKLRIVASFYPLADLTRHVAEGAADVTSITPAGVEPHDFEPSPRQLAQIERADLFIFNGSGLDPWAERFAESLRASGVPVLNMTDELGKMTGVGEDDPGRRGGKSGGDGIGADPHFWLDPVLAMQMSRAIEGQLAEIKVDEVRTFAANREGFEDELTELDVAYKEALTGCMSRTIVTTHSAFGYLAKRYDFEIISIAGLSPEDDPSPRRLSEIARILRDKKVDTVFFETLTSPKFAETLAEESGAKTAVLDPIEGVSDEDRRAGKDYLTIMRENLDALARAMECGPTKVTR